MERREFLKVAMGFTAAAGAMAATAVAAQAAPMLPQEMQSPTPHKAAETAAQPARAEAAVHADGNAGEVGDTEMSSRRWWRRRRRVFFRRRRRWWRRRRRVIFY
jgi:hypothetical protein